jgi:hypothetical protein
MFWGFVFLATGVGWMLRDLGYLPKEMDIFWPILFVAIGLSIIFSSRRKNDSWIFWEKIERKDKN